jgi:hypothetical protein
MGLASFKLPLRFSAARLRDDLRRIPADAWVAHFNDRYYEGDWSAVALRAVGGDAKRIYPDPSAKFADTELLSRCSNLREALSAFECEIGSARLLRLGPGSRIREHSDLDMGVDDGTVRLHVPISTDPLVDFVVAGQRVEMREGECWFFDASLPHRVNNRSASDRVHLVVDCQVDEWLRSLLPIAAVRDAAETPVPATGFEAFRRYALRNLALQERLRLVQDRKAFPAHAVEVGREQGFEFEADDVASAIEASRRARREWWL